MTHTHTHTHIYIYIFFEAVIVIMCNNFPKLLKTHFFFAKELFSKLQAKSLKNQQNDIAAVMKTKRHFAMSPSKIKTML